MLLSTYYVPDPVLCTAVKLGNFIIFILQKLNNFPIVTQIKVS